MAVPLPGLFLLWAGLTTNQVTVTQPAALERFSPTGEVIDIQEAAPGEKFHFAGFDGRSLIVTDEAGQRYRIAEASTDYAAAPDDLVDLRGGPVTPADDAQITPEAQANLAALVADRPELLTLMRRQDDLWTWLAVHFSNGGWTIRYSNRETPLKHYLAQHTYTADHHPVIFVVRTLRNGTRIPPEAQLSGVVFELLNATHQYEFEDVVTRGARGDLTREQFIFANARIEFAVCRETQQFYREVWRPHVLRNHVHDTGGDWHLSIGDDFAKWIAYHRKVSRDGYPDDVYGAEYDAIMAHCRAAEKVPAASSADMQK